MKSNPMFNRKLFRDIFPSVDDFVSGWLDSGLDEDPIITVAAIKKTYMLLFAKYSNSPITNNDEEQFKYKVWSIIFQYCPNWLKKLELQKKLRDLTDDELVIGEKTISNHAMNPSTLPTTSTTSELDKIDAQNVSIIKKSKINAYSQVYGLLSDNVTENYISRFKDLFMKVVARQCVPLWEGEDE